MKTNQLNNIALLLLLAIIPFLLAGCSSDGEDAILGTSVNEKPHNVLNDIDLDASLPEYNIDLNDYLDSLAIEAEDYELAKGDEPWYQLCYSADSVDIYPGFHIFEFRIVSPNEMYCSFKNENCGCDDVTFTTSSFMIYKDINDTNKVLVRILRNANNNYSFVQIYGNLDANYNITDATSYFANFPEFGVTLAKFFEEMIVRK